MAHGIRVESMKKFQADRQGVPEQTFFIRFAQFNDISDHLHPRGRRFRYIESLDDLIPQTIVEITFPVPGLASDERGGEGGLVELFPVLFQQALQPLLRLCHRHHLMGAAIDRLTQTYPADRPPGLRILPGLAQPLQEPVSQFELGTDRQPFQGGRRV